LRPLGRTSLAVLALAVCALLTAFLVWSHRLAAPSRMPETPAAVTELLAVLDRQGLGAALDTLEETAARDSAVLREGHQLAHALGRRALERAGGGPSVLGQCRPVFASGCYHGVVEAHLDRSHRIDMTELEQMCASAGSEQNPAPVYECVHGLGHGVLGALRLDLPGTLRHCDALPEPRFASACQEGAFMEAINTAVAGPRQRHGDQAHEHHAATPAGLSIDPGDPYAPCNRFKGTYAESCWPFQGFVILRHTRFDPAAAFRTCDAAPRSVREPCYRSLGFQLAGLFQRDDQWILAQCAKGRPELASSCAAGATIALSEMDWSGARTMSFCAASEKAWREACYRMAGARLTSVTSPTRRAELCRQLDGRYAEVCRASAGLAPRR
jgi:hypothetical protein